MAPSMSDNAMNNNTNIVPQSETIQPTDLSHETTKKEVEEEEVLQRTKQEFLSEAHEREETQRNQNSFIFSNNAPQQSKLQLQIYYN